MNQLIRQPLPLQPGDLLQVIAPSGSLREMEPYTQGLEVWRSQGYRLEIPELQSWGYLAGTDQVRRQQLQAAWTNPEVRGILCMRGGYGTARILEDWQWQPLDTPKWLIGFSDVTNLLWSLYQQGIGSIHGAVLTTLGTEPPWSIERLFTLLQGQEVEPLQGLGWGGGRVTGQLLPGNLTVATHLLGTPWQPDLTGVILALEDVTEAPYRIDRYLTQWRASGALQLVKGIALGRFSRCDPPSLDTQNPSHKPSWTVEEVLVDRLGDLGIPIVSGLPFGHDGENAALPVGRLVELDGDRGTLSILPPVL